MKNLLLPILVLSLSYVTAQTPCVGGMAGPYDCSGYDLLSQIPLSTMNSTRANDSWGWTDPQDGKEYAIICLNEATAFIDVSDPINPVYLGKLPTENNSSTWRDAKTYNNYVFIVSEDPGHGMQIFDLTRLRSVNNPPVIFTKDAHYTGFGGAHNIVINEETGFAYGVGTNVDSGGPHFVNIQDPLNPVGVGSFSAEGYTHDAQVVIYDGPDTDYTGRELLFGSNETKVVIVDVTDKANPQTISTVVYPNVEYTHQGWLTEDHRYFLLGDEADEIDLGIQTRTIIFDLEDLDNPQFHFEYTGTTSATDHNGYVKGDNFYLSNNAAGLRVMDISDLANQNMSETGYFDSYLPDNNAGYNGAWNVYPFFQSGNIVISDRTQGFLFVRPSVLSTPNQHWDSNQISIYPNPAQNVITVEMKNTDFSSLTIVNILGQEVYFENNINSNEKKLDISKLSKGVYFLKTDIGVAKKFIKI